MKLVPRDYQALTDNKICSELEKYNRVLGVLPTGAGKSISIAILAQKLTGRSLILTHRIEIWEQNSAWIKNIGKLSAGTRKVEPLKKCDIVIAMAQTLDARIKKHGIDYIGSFDNIILDEVHVDIFRKVYSQYDFKKLIGFTATPLTNKVEKMTVDDVEYKRPLSMKRDFESLVSCITEQDLIDLGFLTQDYNIVLEVDGFEKLVDDDSKPDGYTSQSLTDVYSNTVNIEILYKAYENYCIGKKVMLFNATTKVNKLIYDYFKSKGINCKLFDSVNQSSLSRRETIDWFKNEREAVLINANIFTTGFDVDDVEVIIVNRATKSLTLWLQICGRGSRITNKIFKDKFTVIDLGRNLHTHGRWSKVRDWYETFKDYPWVRKNKADMLDLWECSHCGSFNLRGEVLNEDGMIECAFCHECREVEKNPKKDITGKFVIYDDPIIPNAKKIVSYALSLGEDSAFAFRLAKRQILTLFITHTNKEDYLRRRDRYILRAKEIFRRVYFAILYSDLQGKNRRLNTEYKHLIETIDKYYGL